MKNENVILIIETIAFDDGFVPHMIALTKLLKAVQYRYWDVLKLLKLDTEEKLSYVDAKEGLGELTKVLSREFPEVL